MDSHIEPMIRPSLPLFSLGDAVKCFEMGQCTVLEAKRHSPDKFEFVVTWAQTHDLSRVWLLIQKKGLDDIPWIHVWEGEWSDIQPHFGDPEDSGLCTQGCYLPEVIGSMCRVWATG